MGKHPKLMPLNYALAYLRSPSRPQENYGRNILDKVAANSTCRYSSLKGTRSFIPSNTIKKLKDSLEASTLSLSSLTTHHLPHKNHSKCQTTHRPSLLAIQTKRSLSKRYAMKLGGLADKRPRLRQKPPSRSNSMCGLLLLFASN